MKSRRTHSSIDNLPVELQRVLEAMLVDNEWPDDYAGKMTGKPRYKDLESYCKQKGFTISKSAIGRFAQQMAALAAMKQRGLISKIVLKNLTPEETGQTQRAVAELLTAKALDLTATDKKLSAKEIKDTAQGVRECVNIGIKAITFNQEQLKEKADKAAKSVEALVDKKQISPETLKIIREQIYGIVS